MKTLGELAQTIKAKVVGDPNAPVARARAFEMAVEGDVTLATAPGNITRIEESPATAFIVADSIPAATRNLLVASNPKLAFARAIQALHGLEYAPLGVSEDLVLGEGSVLGNNLSIHARVTIGRRSIVGNRVTLHPGVVIGDDCRIGDDTVLHPNVTVYGGCELGQRVVVHAGTVIGAEGFSFVPDESGNQIKLLQIGRVVIEDDCEIGANCAIDRAGFGDTILRRGVKLDNLIQIGHGCVIGENTVIAALSGFAGGTTVGRDCVFAGQSGINHHITIGDRVTVLGKGAITKNVGDGRVIAGMCQDHNSWLRSQVLYSKLPEIVDRLRQLEKKLESGGDTVK